MKQFFRRKKNRVSPDYVQKGAAHIQPEDVARVVHDADAIYDKVKRNPKFQEFLLEIRQLLGVVKDYWKKDYTEIPWYAITAITFTLLYVLNPFDLSPDYIPFIGFIDDASVLTLAISMVKKDLVKYNQWKARQEEGALE